MNEAMVLQSLTPRVTHAIAIKPWGFPVVLFLLLFFFPSPVRAQSVSLSVSPPVVEILLAPNKKVSQTFTFTTQGENVIVSPEIHLVKPDGSTGHVIIDPSPIDPSTIPLTITSSPALLSPLCTSSAVAPEKCLQIRSNLGDPSLTSQSIPITLTFEAASSDISQDVYLALVIKVTSADLPLNKQSVTTPAISALILTTITPDGILPINLEIKDFTLPLIHDSWLPFIPKPTITNNSSIMMRPEGTYEIISPTSKTILSLPIYPNLILGNSSRSILGSHTRCEGSPHTGCVDLDSTPLAWTPKWSHIGPYRIRLIITSQGGTKISEIEKVVWILPLRLIFIGCILIIIIYRLTYYDKKTIVDI